MVMFQCSNSPKRYQLVNRAATYQTTPPHQRQSSIRRKAITSVQRKRRSSFFSKAFGVARLSLKAFHILQKRKSSNHYTTRKLPLGLKKVPFCNPWFSLPLVSLCFFLLNNHKTSIHPPHPPSPAWCCAGCKHFRRLRSSE